VTFLPVSSPASPHGPPTVRPGRQHERRLLAAFDAIDAFPCLDASRERVLEALRRSSVDLGPVVAVVESDLALTVRLLRDARATAGRSREMVGSVREAVVILGPTTVRALVAATPTVDFFSKSGSWGTEPMDYRRHVTAVQAALHRIAARTSAGDLDRLMTAAVLHDIGKLVLNRAHAGFVDHPVPEHGTPEQRLAGERRATGIDHALVGGVLVRRWGLSTSLARLVECHHVDEPTTDRQALAVLRLADALAHFGRGGSVSPARMTTLARRAGLDREQLRELLYDQDAVGSAPPRDLVPSPLSERETEVLRHLSEGLVYKQIATRLDLATSTVRTHLHNIYLKLGAVDRAQAVLIAVRSGWI
jgi:HD-like signal output (HDOD) protein/DNA-binding CsgD family transcriptional regulator